VQRNSTTSPPLPLIASALDEIGVAQPHLGARRQGGRILRRVLHEIVLLDIELAAEAMRRVPAAGSSGD